MFVHKEQEAHIHITLKLQWPKIIPVRSQKKLLCILECKSRALGKQQNLKVVITCCRPDAAGLTELCYVEHNTVSPTVSGLQHVTTTFKFYCFHSEGMDRKLGI